MSIELDYTPIILAGGFGSRLRSVVSDRPKVLAEINGKPFITFILNKLENEGFKNIILSTGYMGDMIKKTIGEEYKGLTIKYFKEDKPLGTGGALKNIGKFIKQKNLLVMNGDTLHNINTRNLIDSLKGDNDNILGIYKNDASRYGLLKIDRNKLILSFNEKNNKNKSGLINIGTYFLNKENLLKYNDDIFSIENDYFPKRIKEKKLYVQISRGKFIDIGIPEDYFKACKYI